jgi:hypothetical protein
MLTNEFRMKANILTHFEDDNNKLNTKSYLIKFDLCDEYGRSLNIAAQNIIVLRSSTIHLFPGLPVSPSANTE